MSNSVTGRGATWAKWDLHVHTPASLVHRYHGETDPWDRFLSELEALPPEFQVLGINDYWFLDGYRRILSERSAGRLSNIAEVLPVVEMRLDQFGGSKGHLSRANVHVIFDPSLDPELIQAQFLNAMTPHFRLSDPSRANWGGVITRESLTDLGNAVKHSVPADQLQNYGSDLQEGFNNLVISLESLEEVLRKPYFDNKAIVALGKTEWADIKWQDGAIASKKHLINFARLLFTAFEDASDWRDQRAALDQQGVPSFLVDCSDAHTWTASSTDKDRIGNCATWVRASPSFPGLLHALAEFDQRVFVGNEPDDLARRRRAPDRILDRVTVSPRPGSSNELFNYELPLNQGLVAIIGNKGQGKSALLDCIARAGNSARDAEFAFLNPQRFLHPRNEARTQFEAKVSWADGTHRTAGLHEQHDRASLERVEYLPQRLIERICSSDPSSQQRDSFESELTRVLFHHIPPVERQGQSDLSGLLQLKTAAVGVELTDLRRRLLEQCEQYVSLESRVASLVMADLVARREDLLNLRARAVEERVAAEARLRAVESATEGDERLVEDRARLESLSQELADVTQRVEAISREAAEQARLLSEAEAVLVDLRGLASRARDVARRLGGLLGTADELIRLEIRDDLISSYHAGIRSAREQKLVQLEDLSERLRALQSERDVLEARLGHVDAERDAARRALEQTITRIRSIEGAHDEPGTIAYVEREIGEAGSLPALLSEARLALLEGAREAHALLRRRLAVVEELYAPAADFVANSSLAQDAGLEFVSEFLVSPSWKRFGEELDGRRSADLVAHLDQMLAAISLDHETELVDGLGEVLDRLTRQRGAIDGAPRPLRESFRANVNVAEYLVDLVSLAWIKDQFSLTGRGLSLDQLSPGERGLILLLFYLVVDREDLPLLLDQPEENLDNAAVRRVLVPALHDARKRRQVLMVTHNANLAVVGDADQIIYCTYTNGRFEAEAGSLAEAATGRYSIDVLEGARPAFENRRDKYDSLIP